MTDQKESEHDLSSFNIEHIGIKAAAALAVGDEWPESMERERGILSDVDRRFLWGFKEYDYRQQYSERRRYIRNRTVNGIRDLSHLRAFDEDFQERVFNALEEEIERGELRESVAGLLEFLYLGLNGDIEWFEETIAYGISNAERTLQPDEKTYYAGASSNVGVDVDIEVTQGYDVDEIEDRFRSGGADSLTPAEVGVLVRQGRVESEELVALDFTVQDRLDPDTGEIEHLGPNPTFRNQNPSTQDQDAGED